MVICHILAVWFIVAVLPGSEPIWAASDPSSHTYDVSEGSILIGSTANGMQVQYGAESWVEEDIPAGTGITIIGDSTGAYWVEVDDAGVGMTYNIALHDVSIDAKGVGSPFLIRGGEVNLSLVGISTLIGHEYRAGLEIEPGGALSVCGVGSLNVTGGYGAAGLGGGLGGVSGPITVNSTAVINAYGGAYGAGIGGGDYGCSNAIVIKGGTVTAVGGSSAAGIGGGRGGSYESIEICGSAHIARAQGGDGDEVHPWAGGAGIGSGGSPSTLALIKPTGTITISAGVDIAVIRGGRAGDESAAEAIGSGGGAGYENVAYNDKGLYTVTYHAYSLPDVTQSLTYTRHDDASDAVLPLLYNIQAYNPDFVPPQFEGFWYDIVEGGDSGAYAAGTGFSSTEVSHIYAQATQELSPEEQWALAVSEQPYNEYVEKVRSLQQECSDVKGWIRVAGTVINYPLLQSEDNEFYAKHNYKQNEIQYGSIFMNARSNLKDTHSNIIIYGHNMKDNQMFGSLSRYSDPNYYYAHPIIHIATDEVEAAYQIICVFRSRVYPTDYDAEVFRYYHHVSFPNAQLFEEYLGNCKSLQLYDTGETAEYGDQLVVLSTCEYTQENGRFLVVAKRLPLGTAV